MEDRLDEHIPVVRIDARLKHWLDIVAQRELNHGVEGLSHLVRIALMRLKNDYDRGKWRPHHEVSLQSPPGVLDTSKSSRKDSGETGLARGSPHADSASPSPFCRACGEYIMPDAKTAPLGYCSDRCMQHRGPA